MIWNWQQKNWPNFQYDSGSLANQELLFQRESGIVIGSFRFLPLKEKSRLVIELISTEAIKTSEIEGENLDRKSIQSSLQRKFGLAQDDQEIKAAEHGIAEMLGNLYQSFDEVLTHKTLFYWHIQLMADRKDLESIGQYRSNPEPMLIVSGAMHAPIIHFEAPPSSVVCEEMTRFLEWFNRTGPKGNNPLPTLTRAGIAHLYFVSIHPFEDGNGRIGRAIAEKALAQGIGQAAITAFSLIIQKHRRQYYEQLEIANKDLRVDSWLHWFADIVLEAQKNSLEWVNFLVNKGRILNSLKNELNPRQKKVLLRIMKEGPDGFRGGLSAKNYITITGASPATSRRDLSHLVELKALTRTGENKGTRYWLNFHTE